MRRRRSGGHANEGRARNPNDHLGDRSDPSRPPRSRDRSGCFHTEAMAEHPTSTMAVDSKISGRLRLARTSEALRRPLADGRRGDLAGRAPRRSRGGRATPSSGPLVACWSASVGVGGYSPRSHGQTPVDVTSVTSTVQEGVSCFLHERGPQSPGRVPADLLDWLVWPQRRAVAPADGRLQRVESGI